MGKDYCVYIMASKRNGTIYVGVTNDLRRRVLEHKHGMFDGFTKRYNVHTLVYYEIFDQPETAIHREKCVKEWKRSWKIDLIEKKNPKWTDLSVDWL